MPEQSAADTPIPARGWRRIPLRGLNRDEHVCIARHRLPHWTQPGAAYFITFRLADSIPLALQQQWVEEREIWLKWHPDPWTAQVQAEYDQRFTERQEQWLDAGMGSCCLRRPEVRRLVEDCLIHFDGQRYDLDCYVLMPNHVHALTVPSPGHALFDLLHGIKGVSARDCNLLLNRTGQAFWMDDTYTRIVRDSKELAAFRHYIAENPVKANLAADEYTLVLNEILYVE